MTILASLKSINPYPLHDSTFIEISVRRGLDLEEKITETKLASKEYRLARADVLRCLAGAPDVSQSGISYRFTDKDKAAFLDEANGIYSEYDDDYGLKTKYGYKGNRL
jgi:hypothetical protein